MTADPLKMPAVETEHVKELYVLPSLIRAMLAAPMFQPLQNNAGAH